MDAFRNGNLDVLVATTVIEVGVDVPNATLMVVHQAERFGLSQLHQLRGRIGRGKFQGYCFLFSQSDTPEATKRLAAMESTSDGFQIAAVDFQLRGPGDVLGTRQSGSLPLRLADLTRDQALLDRNSRTAAFNLVETGGVRRARICPTEESSSRSIPSNHGSAAKRLKPALSKKVQHKTFRNSQSAGCEVAEAPGLFVRGANRRVRVLTHPGSPRFSSHLLPSAVETHEQPQPSFRMEPLPFRLIEAEQLDRTHHSKRVSFSVIARSNNLPDFRLYNC